VFRNPEVGKRNSAVLHMSKRIMGRVHGSSLWYVFNRHEGTRQSRFTDSVISTEEAAGVYRLVRERPQATSVPSSTSSTR
jgi:hypothetical protein